jgi:LETM1-like protein
MRIPATLFRSAWTVNVQKNASVVYSLSSIATVHRTTAATHSLLAQDQLVLRIKHKAAFQHYQNVRLMSTVPLNATDKSTTLSKDNGRVAVVSAHHNRERPMTIRERILTFPSSVYMLWKDWQLHVNIRDAAATKRNAWTVPNNESSVTFSPETHALSVIPWRQREQQRRFLDSLSTVLPTVVLWLLPIIGYVPMFLAILAPRQLLSRHFFNQYEILQFNRLEYQQRYEHYLPVQQLAASAFGTRGMDELFCNDQHWSGFDSAGPLPVDLDHVMEWVTGSTSINATNSSASLLDRMSRRYLVEFALAVGVYPTLASPWNSRLARCSPTWWLQRQVLHLAKTLAEDDRALLRLLHEEEGCGIQDALGSLTDVEIMDACLLRGLPLANVTSTDMRQCLVNHLRILRPLMDMDAVAIQYAHDPKRVQKSSVLDSETIGMVAQHLAIIRDRGKQRH